MTSGDAQGRWLEVLVHFFAAISTVFEFKDEYFPFIWNLVSFGRQSQ
jgi:hypothetical protein